MGNLSPTIVPPQTIEDMNAKIKAAQTKVLGTTGNRNTVVVVSDVVIPELTIEQQALIDAITPKVGPDGYWYIGDVNTNVLAANYLTSPDGSIWTATGIDDTGTNVVWTKVLTPTP